MQQKTLNFLHRHAIVFKQHKCHVNEQDYDAFEDKMLSLQKVCGLENSIYSICDFNTKRFFYFSPRLKDFLGYPHDLEWLPGTLDGFYALIHPDDLNFVLETEIMVYDYLHHLPLHQKQNLKLTYDYRIKSACSHYLRFVQRLLIAEYDKFGHSWLALVISELIPGNKECEISRRYLVNIQTNETCLFADEINPKSTYMLTLREREILKLIFLGHDNKTISNLLFISISTINNHRQNILRKTNSINMMQAIHIARCFGCI